MSARRSFAWQSGVSDYTVEGVVDVVFEPGHVVFMGPGQRVLLAERNDRVSHLRETTAEPEPELPSFVHEREEQPLLPCWATLRGHRYDGPLQPRGLSLVQHCARCDRDVVRRTLSPGPP